MRRSGRKFIFYALIAISACSVLFCSAKKTYAVDSLQPGFVPLSDISGQSSAPAAAPQVDSSNVVPGVGKAQVQQAIEDLKERESKETELGDFMGWVMGVIMKFAFTIASLIVAIAGKLFNWAFSITTFKGIAAVDTTWKVLRDLCNMFFIVILMVSAIATILRIEKYNIGSILKPLLIAIIAINFSKTITYVVVDFTQVLSRSFLSVAGMAQTDAGAFQISEQLVNNMGLTAIFKAPRFWSGSGGTGWKFLGTWDMAWSTLFAAVVMLVAGVAFAVGAVMLIVRLVMIWLLIAVSSVAWGFYAFPDLRKWNTAWWNKLKHYAFFAPTYAFYIGFALILVRGGGYTPMQGDLLTGSGVGDFFKFSGYFINYLITIIILFWAIGQAKGMDKHLGGQIVDWTANKGQKFLKNRIPFRRTGAAMWAEHKAREEAKEKLKQETAKDWAGKAYRPKDWAHGKIAGMDTAIRGGLRELPGGKALVREKSYGAEVLETRRASETNKERLDKAKEYKDTPPSADKFKDIFVDNKRAGAGEKQALAQYLGDHTGNFDTDSAKAYIQFKNAISAFGSDKTAKDNFIRTVGKSRVDLTARYKAEISNGRSTFANEINKAVNGMSAKDISDQRMPVYNTPEFISEIHTLSPRIRAELARILPREKSQLI